MHVRVTREREDAMWSGGVISSWFHGKLNKICVLFCFILVIIF